MAKKRGPPVVSEERRAELKAMSPAEKKVRYRSIRGRRAIKLLNRICTDLRRTGKEGEFDAFAIGQAAVRVSWGIAQEFVDRDEYDKLAAFMNKVKSVDDIEYRATSRGVMALAVKPEDIDLEAVRAAMNVPSSNGSAS